jgi:hypothetical protein
MLVDSNRWTPIGSKPERMIFLTDVEQPNGRPFAVERNWLMRRRVRRN